VSTRFSETISIARSRKQRKLPHSAESKETYPVPIGRDLQGQNQLVVNRRSEMGTKLSAFGILTWHYANSDTGGAGYFPSNPYDPGEDYAAASLMLPSRILGGSASLALRIPAAVHL